MIYYDQVQNSSLLEREVAFRINAIRETFEETGVMLAVNDNSSSSFILEDLDLSDWRSRVHDNPSDFIMMCKHFDISPDIWSLYEWSDWLTPLHLKTKSRFDTIFYIALFSGQMPNSDHVMAPDGNRYCTTLIDFMTVLYTRWRFDNCAQDHEPNFTYQNF